MQNWTMKGDKLGVGDYVVMAFLLIVPILCVLQVIVMVVRALLGIEYIPAAD